MSHECENATWYDMIVPYKRSYGKGIVRKICEADLAMVII